MKLTNLVSLVSVSMILFSSASTSQTAGNSSHYQSTINQYCVTCHNDALSTAGLSLQGLDLEDVSQSAEILEKVLRKLKAKSMPPSGMPRPDDATYISFANYLQSALDSHAEMNPNPARASIRRLT
ncbi:MAG: hypothetical protein ACKVHQ_03640, partial [Gammaproteobacteria bacterium]